MIVQLLHNIKYNDLYKENTAVSLGNNSFPGIHMVAAEKMLSYPVGTTLFLLIM